MAGELKGSGGSGCWGRVPERSLCLLRASRWSSAVAHGQHGFRAYEAADPEGNRRTFAQAGFADAAIDSPEILSAFEEL